jgi:hypothetical protein
VKADIEIGVIQLPPAEVRHSKEGSHHEFQRQRGPADTLALHF